MSTQNQFTGRVMVEGARWWNRGRVWKALVATEADQKGEMPQGSVLVLKDGDIAIPEETIKKSVAVLIEQNDVGSRIVSFCRTNRIPCLVNIVDLFNQIGRFDYLEIDSRHGTIKKFNPGLFGQTSTYHEAKSSEDETIEAGQKESKDDIKAGKPKSFLSRLFGK